MCGVKVAAENVSKLFIVGNRLFMLRKKFAWIYVSTFEIQLNRASNFTLEMESGDIAISLNGRYLACDLSNGTVKFWEVADRTERLTFKSGSPITCLCWLAPEEQLAVVNETLVHIQDISTPSCCLTAASPCKGGQHWV